MAATFDQFDLPTGFDPLGYEDPPPPRHRRRRGAARAAAPAERAVNPRLAHNRAAHQNRLLEVVATSSTAGWAGADGECFGHVLEGEPDAGGIANRRRTLSRVICSAM
jgi:hypothetical protein